MKDKMAGDFIPITQAATAFRTEPEFAQAAGPILRGLCAWGRYRPELGQRRAPLWARRAEPLATLGSLPIRLVENATKGIALAARVAPLLLLNETNNWLQAEDRVMDLAFLDKQRF